MFLYCCLHDRGNLCSGEWLGAVLAFTEVRIAKLFNKLTTGVNALENLSHETIAQRIPSVSKIRCDIRISYVESTNVESAQRIL